MLSGMPERAGLAGIRFHDLRHSRASLMLKQGVHPKIVQERLGHYSIKVTLDTYSHVAPGLQRAAAEQFNRMLQPAPSREKTEFVTISWPKGQKERPASNCWPVPE